MMLNTVDEDDARIQNAIAELKELILTSYPAATFDVSFGDDPEGVYLTATVDVEDVHEVVSVFIDRLVDLQVDEGLPLYVIPVEPPERVYARLASNEPSREQALLPATAEG